MANLSKEGFARQLKAHIEAHEPFVAYWHPHGHGVMLTGPVTSHKRYLEDKFDHQWRTDKTEAVIQARKAAPGVWWKSLAKLRKWHYSEVVTVEFDGENISMEGDLELL